VEPAVGVRPGGGLLVPSREYDDAFQWLASLGVEDLRSPGAGAARPPGEDGEGDEPGSEDHQREAPAARARQNASRRQRPSPSTAKRTSKDFGTPASVRRIR